MSALEQHAREVKSGDRFEFGKNWREFLSTVTDERVTSAEASLRSFLRCDRLDGMSFLDIGSGSGLFSLAARRLGATVHSFDYDPQSVACTQELRRRYAGNDNHWLIERGSALDRAYLSSLGHFDIVYSWGVLHHTGDMWAAVRNAAIPMKDDGVFYIALYSSENYVDPPPKYWLELKRDYNRSGPLRRQIMEYAYVWRFHVMPALKAGQNFLDLVRTYGLSRRGMSFWTDVKDWLGGYPMDFASLKDTQAFCARELGLDLVNVKTGRGCTEFLFCQIGRNQLWRRIQEGRELIAMQGPYTCMGGFSYSFHTPKLEAVSDCAEAPQRSQLMLYEDGNLLGLAHALHADIARWGAGRFSHWQSNLLFSSSDNSDPNSNGRRYAYCAQF